MEVDDEFPCKFPRIGNGNGSNIESRLSYSKVMDDQYRDEEEGENKKGVQNGGGVSRFYGCASSRIVRVSRTSGGKDRHSKVLTSKGLRDRRVRLSVDTAIQFYDLQDRLGYDQPSKAVEWLLKAAATSITELPPMSTPFPDTAKQLSDEKRSSNGGSDQLGFDSAEVDNDAGTGACGGGGSETSRNSGLSLSRSETRIKARERAKGRIKEKEQDPINPISQNTSFTELLNGGMHDMNNGTNSPVHQNPNDSNFFQKSQRLWSSSSSTPMDYFGNGFLGQPPANRPAQISFSNSLTSPPLYTAEHQPELQQFSFVTDNSNNHLNFTISSSGNSSGYSGFNGGTLQSNSSSQSMLNQFQRFPHIDGTSTSAFSGAGISPPVENHHQFIPGFDARLQLFYGDSGQKGKGKS